MKNFISGALALTLVAVNTAAVFAQDDAPADDTPQVIELVGEVAEIEPHAWFVAAAEAIGVSVEALESQATIAEVAKQEGVRSKVVIQAVQAVAMAEVDAQIEEQNLNARKAKRLQNRTRRAVRLFIRTELGEHANADIMRLMWDVSGFDSYTYVIDRPCFCLVDENAVEPFKYYITVVDGEVTKVESRVRQFFLEEGQTDIQEEEVLVELDRETNGYLFITIDDVIDTVEAAEHRGVASLSVEQDTMRGYPTSVAIDYDQFIADEELYYDISKVKRYRP